MIADLQLKFSGDTNNPLRTLQKAVQSGRFAQLEVDKSFFQMRHKIGKAIHNYFFYMKTSSPLIFLYAKSLLYTSAFNCDQAL